MNNRQRAFALLLAGALVTAGAVQPAAAFSDVTDPETSLAVSVLEGMGIVSGYDDGGYHPDATLTRAEFSKLAVVAMGLSGQVSPAGHRTLFNDVPSSHWASGYVNLAYDQGIINGYGNGSFGPADAITYDQMVTILLRMLGYTSSDIGPFWPTDYLSFADDLGLNDGLGLSGGDTVNRGEAAVLLYRALQCDTKEGQTYALTTAGKTVENVILLSVSADAGDGRTNTVQVLENGQISYYTQQNQLPQELSGQTGTLLLTSAGKVTGFLPDEESDSRTVSVSSVNAAGITAKDGTTYSVPASAVLVWQGDIYQWETGFANVKAGSAATLYYDESGSISALFFPSATSTDAVVLSATPTAATLGASFGLGASGWALTKNGSEAQCGDLSPWDVVTYDATSRTILASDCRLTGYLTQIYPSADAATSVTVAGKTLSVLPCAQESLQDFAGGDKVTLLLTDGGQVAMALSPSELQADMIGLLAQDGRSITLANGLTLTGTFEGEDDLLGSVVQVSPSDADTFSFRSPSGGVDPARLDVTAGTMGSYALAPSVTVYEWAGAGYAVQIALSDLPDTVSASDISYAHCNDAGQIDILVVEGVTGSCYTYGFAVTGTQTTNSAGGFSYTNGTLAVQNSGGTGTAYLTGAAVKKNAAIGLVGKGDGKLGDFILLFTAEDILRDDFNGVASVDLDGVEYPISDDVQVYNEDTQQWTTLENAKAYGNHFTIYYDRTPGQGGQVRIITVTQ